MKNIQFIHLLIDCRIKMKLLVLLILPLANCAMIPHAPDEYHRCLVSYIRANGISSDFTDELNSKINENCEQYHKNIAVLLGEVYNGVEENLKSVFENQTEVQCLMETFRNYKYLEIGIVMHQAYLTSPEPMEKAIAETADRSKVIFTIATMKCIMTNELLMEIMYDFTKKVNVNDDELECIQLLLKELSGVKNKTSGSSDGEITTPGWSDEETTTISVINEETTKLFAEIEEINDALSAETETANIAINQEYESTTATEDTATTDDTTDYPDDIKNDILKRSSRQSSSEMSADMEAPNMSRDTCFMPLDNLRNRIKYFDLPSLNEEQNRCMSTHVKENDVVLIFKLIAMRGSRATSEDADLETLKENFKDVIVGYTYAIIDCTDMFQSFANIGNLQELI